MTTPPVMVPNPLLSARQTAAMSQESMAHAVGCSQRTISRWERGLNVPSSDYIEYLARRIHPADPQLAQDVALLGGTTLEAFGLAVPVQPPPALVQPPPGPVVAAAPSVSLERALDAIVLAAAEAIEGSVGPVKAARTALAAATTKARELGVALDDLGALLLPHPPPV